MGKFNYSRKRSKQNGLCTTELHSRRLRGGKNRLWNGFAEIENSRVKNFNYCISFTLGTIFQNRNKMEIFETNSMDAAITLSLIHI